MDHALPRSTGRIVTPRDIRAKSAADGTFKLRALPIDGVGAVLARHPNYSAANVLCTADTTAGAFVVTLYAPAKIAGRVVDSGGLAVEGADLSLLGADITSYAAAVEQDLPKSDAEGRFVILEAPPGHRARARGESWDSPLHHARVRRAPRRRRGSRNLGDAGAASGSRGRSSLRRRGHRGGEGHTRIRAADEPARGGRRGATPGDSAEATTAAEGKFAFEGMGKGPYDVEANYPGFASARKKRYLADGRPLVLKLRRPGSVEVAVTWPADATAPAELEGILEVSQTIGPGFTMAESRAARESQDSRGGVECHLSDRGRGPGSYGLVVKARGFARAKTAGLEVKGAGTATASVALVPGVIASGIVVERGTKQPCRVRA